MKIFNIIIEKERKPELQFPYEFGLIQPTETAKLAGLSDDEFNKEIVHYKGGKVFKVYLYNEAVLKMLEEEGIPIVSEKEGEDFEFGEGVNFGMIYRPHEL